MTETSFGDFVREALQALRREVPDAYARMMAAFGEREVELCVDEERLAVCFRSDPREPVRRPLDPVVILNTSAVTIAMLARGESCVVDEILAGNIDIRGSVDDLVALDVALHAYLCGANRDPHSPDRRSRFLEFSQRRI